MNQNETRTLWLSVASALFAVFLLYSYTQEKSAELTKKFGAKANVVVATQDINEMETINETMLTIVERPIDFIEPKAINNPELAIGKVALAPIKEGEQILESKILKPGPATGLSLQVSPTKRALSLPVDEIRGVAKLLKPGDRIDIIAALDIGKGAKQRREIKTIMEDINILATGVRITNELPRLYEKVGKLDYIKNLREDVSYTNITIEVTPKEAQKLIYIISTSPGSLFLTLRHPSDRKKIRRTLATSNVFSLLGAPPPSRAKKRLPTPKAKPKPKPKPRRSGGFKNL